MHGSISWARAAMAALAFAFSVGAHAQVAPQKTQVPGYYRINIGTIEVTALYDGVIELDAKLLHKTTPQQVQALLARQFRENPTATAVNAYLVNTGSHLVLIDTGAADLFGPTLGKVVDNLVASGYRADQVDTILITHLHGDHVGGVLGRDGKPAFPNATLRFAAKEGAFWLDPATMARAPKDAQGFFKMAQDRVAPYSAAGKLSTFEADTREIVPGVKVMPTPGHTPGHTAYLIESNGQRMLVIGDLVHNAAVQFPKPDVTIEFDIDEKAAAAMRRHVFEHAAKEKVLIAGAHLPFPGIGHVRADGKNAYAYVPVDFSPLR
jgi:glyoxylase-like metal-dependent hydrolase (beta-lactamase superfamily II)